MIARKTCEGVEERTSIFVIDRDLGNVAYSPWIKSVLDQGTMYDLLGQTTNEESLKNVVEMILGDVVLSAQTSIVERCMEDQEGVRAFNRTTPRREREPHDGPEPKAEQTVRPAWGAHERSVGHHEHGQAQTSAIPDGQVPPKDPRGRQQRVKATVLADPSRSSQPNVEKEEKKQRWAERSSSWSQWKSAWERWEFA